MSDLTAILKFLGFAQLPSAAGLVTLVKLAAFVVFAYYLTSTGRWPRVSNIVAFVLLMIAVVGFYEGFTLAVREEARLRYGQVIPGVITEMYRSDGHGRTYATTGHEGPSAGVGTYLLTEPLARWLAYGSPRTLLVDYRYPCSVGRGVCFGRDYVGPDVWPALSAGKSINVRQNGTEGSTARLDENPQMRFAVAQLGVSAVFLFAAGVVSRRIRLLPARRKYLTTDGSITAVESVQYRDATRWKVRYAYFDDKGTAQECADARHLLGRSVIG
jgi:hypothetical protein